MYLFLPSTQVISRSLVLFFFLGAYGSLPDAAIWWCLRTGGGSMLLLAMGVVWFSTNLHLLLASPHCRLLLSFRRRLQPPLHQCQRRKLRLPHHRLGNQQLRRLVGRLVSRCKLFLRSKIVPGSVIRAPTNKSWFQGPGRALCAIQQGGGWCIVLHG
jgi:hypothetical protein